MTIKTFHTWLEQRESEELKTAIKTIVSTSDENAEPLVHPDAQDGEWLGKSTSHLSDAQRESLLNLGVIKHLPSEERSGVQDAIRSGVSFQDLLDMVDGETFPSDIEVGDSPPPPESNIPVKNVPQPSQEL